MRLVEVMSGDVMVVQVMGGEVMVAEAMGGELMGCELLNYGLMVVVVIKEEIGARRSKVSESFILFYKCCQFSLINYSNSYMLT